MNQETIIKIIGKNTWPTTTIMVWVHGNEKAWINALDELLQDFSIDAGTVYCIYANIQAIKEDKRYIEKNMNRCFLKNISATVYEEQRAQEIISYLNQSDYLLDIHNTTNKENSIPMLISEYPELGKYFAVPYVVSWFDILHPGGSDGYMNTIGKVWLCIECWSIYDANGPMLAKESIINFLRYTRNIAWTHKIYDQQEFVKFDTIYKNKNIEFSFAQKFHDMEKISSGQLIAYDGDEEIRSISEGYLLFPTTPKKIGDECFVLWKV